MKKFLMVICFIVLPLMIFANAIPNHMKQLPLYVPDIIKLQLNSDAISKTNLPRELYAETSGFGIPELDRMLTQYGGARILRAHIELKDKDFEQKYGVDRWFVIKFSKPINVMEVIKSFKKNKDIQSAIPEYYAYTQAIPNDTYYANNWGHNNIAQLPGWNPPGSSSGSHSGAGVGTIGYDSHAQLAWNDTQGYGTASTIIAIIDTGADTSHPDLRLVAGYDFGDNDSNPMDNSASPGHGTGCSGVAAAIANNSLGVAGIAGGCSVMPLKVANSAGSLLFTAIENALYYAANNNVHIASMSFGSAISVGSSPSTDTALAYAYSHGVALFAATANDNTSTISYPAKYPGVIAVGASSPTGQRKSTTSSDGEYWWGSNYGVNTQDSNDAVDICAPTILPTTDIVGSSGFDPGSYYMWFNGTSCATPYTAGVAALLLSKNPTLTPSQIRIAMTSNATDMTFDGGVGWDRYTGYGLVNAQAALTSLLLPPQITWSPASFTQSLATNQTANQSLILGNSGQQTLNYTVSKPSTSVTILNESFENGGVIPTGWTQSFVTGTTSWTFTTGGHTGHPATAQDGTYNALLYFGNTTAIATKLITPSMNISGVTSASLTFWHTQALWSPDQDELRVYYRTSSGGTWTLLATYTSNIPSWTMETIPLPSLNSTYYVAFEGTAKFGYGVCVDKVQITAQVPVPSDWLTLNGGNSVSSSILNGGANQNVTVGFNSTGLSIGDYTSSLIVTSNSVTNSNFSIPVTFHVIALSAPINLHFVWNGSNLELHWDSVPGAASYNIYEASTPNGTWILATSTVTNVFIQAVSGLNRNTFYKVTAVN